MAKKKNLEEIYYPVPTDFSLEKSNKKPPNKQQKQEEVYRKKALGRNLGFKTENV